ncbi:DUF1800 domain-containing protein [Hydrocarboniphaga sp.]|uniref:DUF1800 domain-containing protein n=1 Tax=Hydrocarboniphaga sp. TaxID=2033016 RepID=UPI003D0CACB4
MSACGGSGSDDDDSVIGIDPKTSSAAKAGAGTAVAGSDTAAAAPATVVAGIGEREAARLLTQATFGPSLAEIERVAAMSAAAYVDEQIATAPTSHLARCRALKNADGAVDKNSRTDTWWELSLTAPDQLRQRVAFALSEIMVVSDRNDSVGTAYEGLCYYYDILLNHAFGNYRELLEDVTLSPEMGRYLSMLGNRKPDATIGRRADENFGREVMQLFSLGLSKLNPDGSLMLDADGKPIDVYRQADIENMARIFTGWTWGGSTRFFGGTTNWLSAMTPFDSEHDSGAKTLVGNVAVAAGGTARSDLAIALDTLYQHPNVGPFIGRQLIQRLVTSNPSRAYVGRVAAAFNDDGHGVRGNLGAVIRAILLDEEARRGVAENPNFGKVREPLLRQTHLWRALDAQPSINGRYSYRAATVELGQSPLSAPSVFNFFSPGYSPQGGLRSAGLVTPEYQLANESSVPTAANRLYTALFYDYVGNSEISADAIRVDLSALISQAGDVDTLLDVLDLLLMSGQMDADVRATLKTHLAAVAVDADDGRARVQRAVYLLMASPQYLVQR